MSNKDPHLADIQINNSVGQGQHYIDTAILVSFDFRSSTARATTTNYYQPDAVSEKASTDDLVNSSTSNPLDNTLTPDTQQNNEASLADLAIDNDSDSDEMVDADGEPIELYLLATSAGAVVADQYIRYRRFIPTAATYLTKGHIENIQELVKHHEASLVIFDHALSPVQERNLEKAFACRVVDRTRLILDIFAMRAQTKEGKLQVELAQLRYMSTRLVRGWTHLERQKGGIGLRGPGETQLESDRRMVSQRISILEKRLQKVESQRALRRKQRERKPISTVSLVGYTNAGKSSLFNRLTTSNVFVEDKLFATLDPTMRRLELDCGEVIITDTVGFVRDLPHTLVKAFHATLEEIANADLLLHVIDIANEDNALLVKEVNRVLEEIDAQDIPIVHIFNKVDKLDEGSYPPSLISQGAENTSIFVSAHNGLGTEVLSNFLNDFFSQNFIKKRLHLTSKDGKLRSVLYDRSWLKQETVLDLGDIEAEVFLSQADWDWLNHHYQINEMS